MAVVDSCDSFVGLVVSWRRRVRAKWNVQRAPTRDSGKLDDSGGGDDPDMPLDES
jgi:hypothetical protein